MKCSVFDLHCDTALGLLGADLSPKAHLRQNVGHIDLERGKKLVRYAQCFAFFTYPGTEQEFGRPACEVFTRALENFRRELEENAQWIAPARSAHEISEITGSGKIAAVLTLEGTAGIHYDPGRLEELAGQGFRMTTLTWNEQNPLAGSHCTGGGLTARGREYVRRAQGCGMLVDVSHLSEQAFWQIMDITSGPVIATHSNSRSVCPVSRNLTDEQFLAICRTGGVAGLNLYADFLGSGAVTPENVYRHVCHWMELGGEKNIALGGDLDGCEMLPAGFTGVDCYRGLAEALLRAGLQESILEDIFWNNAMRVLEQCSM